MKKLFSSHYFYLLLVTITGFLGIKALLHPGLYTAHDIWHQVARYYHYNQALLDGQFLPMWVSHLAFGYGYPLFVFSYHLPWVVGAPLLWLGIDLFVALKILFGAAFLLSGYAMYLFAYRLTKHKLASATASVLYLWSPYHFLSVFVSASIGTVFAFFLVPFLFLGVQLILEKKVRYGVVLTALSVAGLILTHLMTLALLFPFILGWVGLILLGNSVVTKKSPLRRQTLLLLLQVLLAVALGFLLSAFYLIPLFSYMPLINASEQGRGFTDIYKGSVVFFKQLLYSPWGFGPIISSAKDGEISFQVGIAQWLSVGLAGLSGVWLLFKSERKAFPKLVPLVALLTLFAISLFLMTDYSLAVWEFVNTLVVIDYPFRLLLMAVFFGSLASGVFISHLKLRWLGWATSLFLIAIAMYTNRNHIRVNQYTEIPLQLYLDSEVTTNTFNEYLPKGTDLPKEVELSEVLEPNPQLSEQHQVENLNRTTQGLDFTIMVSTPSAITIRHFDFPGIVLRVNDVETEPKISPKGYLTTQLPEGKYQISVHYEPELLSKVATIISGITLLSLLFLVVAKPAVKLKRKS